MKKKTEENLKDSFAGESQAHLKYLAFADKADKENYPNTARLFRANAFAEQVHATNHLKTLSGVNKTEENLLAAIEGETFEVTKMYPDYLNTAREEGEKKAETVMHWALEAEKVHADLYKKARESVHNGVDVTLKSLHVCGVCGYTVDGDAPETCPVCGSPKRMFVDF